MNITKDYFETQLRRHDKVTVYSQDNTPLTVSRDFLSAAQVTRLSSNSKWTARIWKPSVRTSICRLYLRQPLIPRRKNNEYLF